MLAGYAATQSGTEVKLTVSYDGGTAALIVHGASPPAAFHGVQGAFSFHCQIADGHKLFLDNGNSSNQVVKITGWEE